MRVVKSRTEKKIYRFLRETSPKENSSRGRDFSDIKGFRVLHVLLDKDQRRHKLPKPRRDPHEEDDQPFGIPSRHVMQTNIRRWPGHVNPSLARLFAGESSTCASIHVISFLTLISDFVMSREGTWVENSNWIKIFEPIRNNFRRRVRLTGLASLRMRKCLCN